MTDRGLQRALAYCGIAFLVLLAVGLLLPGWIPPGSALRSAEEVAAEYQDNTTRIRIGVLAMTVGAGFLLPFAVAMSRQMRRIGPGAEPLATLELIASALSTMIFIPACMFWEVAAFRPERDPQLTQLLDDLGWLPFAGITTFLLVQDAALAVAIWRDRNPEPVFPRWFGHLTAVLALTLVPPLANIFVKSGPLASDGFLTFWVPLAVYAAWWSAGVVLLLRAIDADPSLD